MNIKSFVFLDLETTGLPYQQNNQSKITELCFLCVESDHILLGAVPRVQNKLNLCFNPWKLIGTTVEQITGLSNDLLENQGSFDEKTLSILSGFLERLQKPICFVAHNGNNFDFPILKYHIEKVKKDFNTDIFCIDSLQAFKTILSEKEVNIDKNNSDLEISDEWDNSLVQEVLIVENNFQTTSRNVNEIQSLNETTPQKKQQNNVEPIKQMKHKFKSRNNLPFTKKPARKRLNFENSGPSFKLGDIYERIFSKKPENSHHAEIDVKMMLHCAVHLGEKFVNYANNNAKLFSEITKMQPKIIKS